MSEKDLFLLMIFILVVLLSQAFVAPAMGISGKARRLLRKRVRGIARQSDVGQLSLARQQYLATLSPWEQQLETTLPMEKLRALIEQAGLHLPAYRAVLIVAMLSVAGFVGASVQFHNELFAAVAGAAGLIVPLLWLLKKRSQRLQRFEMELPDGINLLSRALRSGMPFSQSLQIAAEEIRGPVGTEFGLVFTEINYGSDTRTALARLLERIPIVPVMALVSSVMIQRESGGNLSELLDRIEHLLRERFRFQRRLKTITASSRMSAWVVSMTPFILSGVLEFIDPGRVMALLEDPGGRKLVVIAFGMEIVGILWIRQMTRIDV